ncbi:MAG: ABC transporter ATP-binding protein [Tissierellia bacterium]|nr:ABC transporter ATP-binding protein [Tissierellia bacterium]
MQHNNSIKSTIMKFAREKSHLYYVTLITSALNGILSVIPYYFIWKILRELVVHFDSIDGHKIIWYGIYIFGSQVLGIIMNFSALLASHYMAFRVETNIRKKSVAHLLTLPIGFFENQDSGRLRRIIDDNASKTHSFIAHIFPDSAAAFSVPVTLFVLMFIINYKLALVCVMGVVLGLLCLMRMTRGDGTKIMEEYMKASENLNINGVEYIRGIPVVKVFNQTVESFQRFYAAIMEYDEKAKQSVRYFQTPMVLYNVALNLPAVLLIPVCILMMGQTEDPLSLFVECIFFLIMSLMLHTTLMRLMTISEGQNIYRVTLTKLHEFFEEKGRTVIPSEKREEEGIVFDHVHFTYPEKTTEALSDIHFHFEKKKSYALVGASGSGKSTLVSLIAGFYSLDSGEIRLDGENIASIPQNELLSKMAIVFQQSSLLKQSLRDNIAMGLQVGDEEILHAMEQSQCTDILDRMDRGLDTMLGTKGTYVSGGEAQRIALARAFLRNRDILLLDEATAYADPENEALIQQSIDALKREKTTITIAHRLNSIKDVDEIVFMDRGKIVATGSHDTLMEKEARYRELYEEYSRSIAWKAQGKSREQGEVMA